MSTNESYTAFEGEKLVARGELAEVVLQVKRRMKKEENTSVLIFNDSSGRAMDFDLRGTEKEILLRLKPFLGESEAPVSSGPGRPKLGVIAREVSLLPRHWEWLAAQSGGASATLRRLVEEAKKTPTGKNLVKPAQERTYKFMSAMAGDFPNFEEAIRALYKKDEATFTALQKTWPADIRDHVKRLAKPVFSEEN